MSRAVSVTQLYNKKRKVVDFTGKWRDAFGCPELKGAWLIWAESGSGKTTFVAMLCKYLTQFARVGYDSLEEGDSETMKLAFQRVGMEEVKSRIILLNKEPISELKERLRKHKAPTVVVIDSVQYADLTYKEYKEMRAEFENTLFIMISHADGKHPEGRVAKKIRFDVDIKVNVVGYRAFVVSRYGGGTPITVWEEGAEKYHGLL